MKESKRESISKTVLRILLVLTILLITSASSCIAGVTIAEKPGKVAVAGNKVYCVFDNGVKSTLKKYNIKTKKSMVLKTYKGEQANVSNFYKAINHVSVKGKYVYYELVKEYEDTDGACYIGIYRVKTDGKSTKRLAYGSDPVIAGNWIYYKEWEKTNNGYSSTGYLSRMKLDGTSKKRLMWIGKPLSRDSTAKELFKYGNEVLYSPSYGSSTLYSLSGKQYSLWNRMRGNRPAYETIYQRIGPYLFFASGSGYSASIYRRNASGGSDKKIYSPNSYLSYIDATSKYLVLFLRDNENEDSNRILLLNENGKVVAKIKR